ncbi:hypothetical protein [Mesoplasma lactucae]|uniref:Uncharacterized protein n=1 Tax=Mesoplasma lactucae ATCC 49193 TaxID=81460 RepID=A0A291IS18_9MOLU|nr:hypothetical protein [Mesoplasma lactucae]ATG97481.1 hypothetical protein CP520_01785 [Mesoplasma lactucae ATCC 49193]ATZ20064.1 ABC transporter permease [Mesoplasma lactucae ATCC 49193]MCL8216812.1 hypothetical protein [Mesoplasma lactucae ATCC 49193]
MNKVKRRYTILAKLWKIQSINYFTDPVNLVLGFILTTITMICWIAFKPAKGGFATDPFILASAIGISIIRNSQYNLNLTIGDWKQKKFFNRLADTPVSKTLVIVSILTFNWFINILVALILFGFAMIFKSQRQILTYVQWGPFFVGFVLNVFLSNVMALFLSTFIKKKDWVLVISLFSYFGPMYLLGLGIPWNVVGNYKGLNIFLYIAPHRYPLAIMQAAWVGTANTMAFPTIGMDVVAAGGGVKPDSWLGMHGFGYGGNGWWLPTVITLGWCLLFGILTLLVINHRYNYGLRKYKNYNGVQMHLRYINNIKKAKTPEELQAIINYINSNSNYDIEEIMQAENKARLLKKENKKLPKGGDK